MPGTTGTQVQCIQLVITNDGEPEGREFFRIRATSSDPGVFIPSIASTSRIEINEGKYGTLTWWETFIVLIMYAYLKS